MHSHQCQLSIAPRVPSHLGITCNLPPEIRYRTDNIIISLSIPGPNSPVDIESFIWPLFEELAEGSEGIWVWDALNAEYFLNRFYCCMGLGDMLGSAKISGMAGHTAVYGDRFSMVKGARVSPGTKAQYYPLDTPDNADRNLNPDRPKIDLNNLPIRNETDYWATIIQLDSANNPTARAKVVRRSGVSRLPLAASSKAFIHPVFFPLDPFHLFYENCMTFFWDMWVASKPGELTYVSPAVLAKIGELIEQANATLPPAFSGPIRNTQAKRNSQYKVYEWMAVLHWYIVPIGIEIGLNTLVLQNFSKFVAIVEFAMTPVPRSEHELKELHSKTAEFLIEYERLYVENKIGNINRMRLCMFQLIHISRHIKWNGSIRIGSQATMEQKIGEMTHRIRSRKAPFANLANLIYERELVRILLLHFASLHPDSDSQQPLQQQRTSPLRPMQKHTWTKRARVQNESHLEALVLAVEKTGLAPQAIEIGDMAEMIVHRWGKLKLSNKRVLKNHLSEDLDSKQRRSCWFEAENYDIQSVQERRKTVNIIFGEAVSFYELKITDKHYFYVVYLPLIERVNVLGTYTRGKWDDQVQALEVGAIRDIVGIWQPPSKDRLYILRKHPGLALLTPEELGRKEREQMGDSDASGSDSSGDEELDYVWD